MLKEAIAEMGKLDVTVNGRSYQIACDDGKEAHLARLAGHLDKRVATLAQSLGQIGESRLLVLAGLLVADELSDAQSALSELKRRPAGLSPEAEDALAAALEAMAARIENIAARLEAA